MITLDEWLTQVGFQHGNPFALKEADKERTLFQAYFVAHPAYNQILDGREHAPATSSILCAPRGAGKSTSRRMFETYCATYRPRSLLVRLTDWMPIAAQNKTEQFAFAAPHIEQIMQEVVAALARQQSEPWLHVPEHTHLRGHLGWMCHTYAHGLTVGQREQLYAHGWSDAQQADDLEKYSLRRMPALRQLEVIVEVLQAVGYYDCYILADNLDEIITSAANHQQSALLLAPLLSNLRLNEVPGLAFKYFVPTDVVQLLQEQYNLRLDRITCAQISWSDQRGHALLHEVLQKRLETFSNGLHASLASLAAPGLRDIDDRLIDAAAGSPRLLLNLGEWLFQACVTHAEEEPSIQPSDLDSVLQRADAWAKQVQLSITEAVDYAKRQSENDAVLVEGDHQEADQQLTSSASEVSMPPSTSAVPLLRIRDGVIWRGEHEFDGWHSLTNLQRELLTYLYERRGKLCLKDDIMRDVWASKPYVPGEDSLRKLVDRLIEIIEPDPKSPVYLEKVRGGHYRLNNAADG